MTGMTDNLLFLLIGVASIIFLWVMSLWAVWDHYNGEAKWAKGQLEEAMTREGKHTDRIRDLGRQVFEKDTEIKRLWLRINDLDNQVYALKHGKELE